MASQTVIALRQGMVPTTNDREHEATEWERLPDAKRAVAMARLRLVNAVQAIEAQYQVKTRPAIEHLLTVIDVEPRYDDLHAVAKTLGQKGRLPGYSTINRWCNDYRKHGMIGLAPAHKGSERKVYGWEARAHYHLKSGARNNAGNITRQLQQEGFQAEYHQVKRYLDSLPAHEGTHSRSRLGDLAYESTVQGYVRRHTDNLPVGACYQSDGNMLPVYLAHPTGERPARFEMTPVIDIASRYLVGYHLSESESAYTTLHALTDAILKERHVPTVDFQSDNGPGFKNQRVDQFFLRLGLFGEKSRPRNPKDNGYIERWHQILKDEFLKFLPGYCGKDAAPEFVKRYLRRVDQGKEQLMSLDEFKARLDQFVTWYNHERQHGELGKRTPAELWAGLQRNEPVDIEAAFFWGLKEGVKVGRESIRFANREYGNPELIAWKGRKVNIEYNDYDDSFVKVTDLKGRWICDAHKIKESPYRSNSIIEDRRQKSLEAKRKRLELKIDELEKRGALTITHTTHLDDIEAMNEGLETQEQGRKALEHKTGTEAPVLLNPGLPSGIETGAETLDDIDFLDTDY